MTDILSVLNSIGYVQLSDFGTHWRTNPIYRAFRSQNSLAIKKATGQWFDHSERSGGSLAQLVQKTLNLPSLDDTKTYMGDLPIVFNVRESTELTETKKFDKSLLLKLVKDNDYWHKRGISDSTLSKFNGGVAITNGRLVGRYVFPIFNEKEDIIGFAGRLLQKNDNLPKWKLLGSKKNWIFPRISGKNAFSRKSVILVESIGDALSLIEVGIDNILVLFGLTISPEIIKTLLKYDIGKISILLNNDSANGFVGNQAAESCKNDLEVFFDKEQIRIITPPQNDLNDMICQDIDLFKKFCSEMELGV